MNYRCDSQLGKHGKFGPDQIYPADFLKRLSQLCRRTIPSYELKLELLFHLVDPSLPDIL